MTVKDCNAMIEVKDTGSLSIFRKGYLDSYSTNTTTWFPRHGREVLLREINSQRVIEIGDTFFGTNQIVRVDILHEPEREEPEPTA